MSDEEKSGGFREGVRQGLGILSAFKEAIEETIQEARERGDLSQERARQAMKSALVRAQEAAEGARERFDFVQARDFEALVERVRELEQRLDRMSGTDESGGSSSAETTPEG